MENLRKNAGERTKETQRTHGFRGEVRKMVASGI